MSSVVSMATAPFEIASNAVGLATGITDPSKGLGWQTQGVDYGANQQEIARQQALLNQTEGQLQQVAAGQGPNPAKAMLAGATGENIKAASGVAASTKGINPALAARLGGQAGTNMMMTSANQAAQLQAQQSLAAQQALLGASTGQQQISGGIIGQANQTQGQLAQTNAQGQFNLIGNLTGGGGTAMGGKSPGATGGLVKHGQIGNNPPATMYAQGGGVDMSVPAPTVTMTPIAGPQSFAGKFMSSPMGSLFKSNPTESSASNTIGQTYYPTKMDFTTIPTTDDKAPSGAAGTELFASGGQVPAKVSPGELYLSPKQVEKFRQTGKIDAQRIPGKAQVSGDSLKNDTVNRNLEAGGIVVPRTKAGDAEKAAKFVAAVLAHSGRGLPKKVK